MRGCGMLLVAGVLVLGLAELGRTQTFFQLNRALKDILDPPKRTSYRSKPKPITAVNKVKSRRQPTLAKTNFRVSDIPGGRVKLDVYFESLCPDTKRFFVQQLYPAWQDLQDIMDLTFIPFGKAQATPTGDGDYSFVCQHGPNECYGNKVQSCVVESLPIHTQMAFLNCMMKKKYPSNSGRECSEEVGVAWEPLKLCANSKEGSRLLYQNGLKTSALKPRLFFVPTITIDGYYDRSQIRVSLINLKGQICEWYQGPPHQSCL